jgi:hypothetical protein
MGQVVLKDINKFYDSVHAVKDVNLQIRDKEFVVCSSARPVAARRPLRMIAGLEQSAPAIFHRRSGGQQPPHGSRHRHGVPELRALPA